MKTYALLAALFATTALAAPAVDLPGRILNNPTKVWKPLLRRAVLRGETVIGVAAHGGSGGEGGLGLAFCKDGCYDYPAPTAGTCEELGD
ncbi:f38b87b5-740a-491b-9933-9c72e54dcfa2 [Thermothielavioides terrestris]|uniref:F38b87b5-740a-491b-9933-9c72e54dcfa2 n=1 Tax=Thermothielavioides terrestris TaxID=2587410 RepID=A0A3S4EZC0_9PEZI|nr:f38b87b5-740a-491b-9933-9c72e54dcfa2 [Thermothielavioides terrestris]